VKNSHIVKRRGFFKEPYRDKVTAMSEVNNQYTWPLLRGTIPNPLEALKDVNRRRPRAGRKLYSGPLSSTRPILTALGSPNNLCSRQF
jgi:hypothetical protein